VPRWEPYLTAPVRPTDAEELATLYKAMNPWAQEKLLLMARSMVQNWPAKRGGNLRLVTDTSQRETVVHHAADSLPRLLI